MNGNGFLPPNDYKNVSPEAKKWALINALMAFGGGLLGRSRYSTVPQTAGENIGPALMEGMGAYGGTLGNAYGMQQDQQDREMKKQMFDLDRQKTQAEIEHLKQPKQPSIADLLNLQKYNDMVEQRKGYPQTVANFLDDKPDMWGNAGVLASMQPEQGSKLIEEYLKNKMLPKEEALTSEIKNYKYAKDNPAFTEYQTRLKKAGSSNVSVSVAGEKEFSKEMGKKTAERITELRKNADEAANSLEIIKQGKDILSKGIYSGSAANIKLGFDKWLQEAGVNVGGETAANTEAYAGLMGKMVGKVIKDFGSGTGLSDADRQYAERIAAGKITMTAESLKKLLTINEKLARAQIRFYNKNVKDVRAGREAGDFLREMEEPSTEQQSQPKSRFTVREIK